MEIIYSDKLFKKLYRGKDKLTAINNIMIQSTGEIGNTTGTFYDDKSTTHKYKQYAHFVIGAASVCQYQYLDSSVFVEPTIWTNKAKELFCDSTNEKDSPEFHTIVIEICLAEGDDYATIEKNVIDFLGKFLVKHDLIRSNLWRRGDLIKDEVGNTPQYQTVANWTKFLDAVGDAMTEYKKDDPDSDLIKATGIKLVTPIPEFEPDTRDLKYDKPTRNIEAAELGKEDYKIDDVAGIETKQDKFTDEFSLQTGEDTFEPIYPDLTVPPKSNPNIYNELVPDTSKIKKVMEKSGIEKKPILGKSVNNSNSYPIDDKIAELELHYPVVKVEDSLVNEMSKSHVALASYIVSLSKRTERRLVQLENILATMTRYTFRMGSRMNINCVYYGGQSSTGKYDCIRCLADDMISDGAILTLDQCLNCSRYEPIIGQVYDILSDINDNHQPSLAPILDDLQMGRMTVEEYSKFTRVETMSDEKEAPDVKSDKLKERSKDEKSFEELYEDAKKDNFTMNWAETTLPQKPDINLYEYDEEGILKEKKDRIKDPYEDGYLKVEKKTISLPNNSYSVSAFDGSFEGTIGMFIWPTTATRISSPFGWRAIPTAGATADHLGIDIDGDFGDPVYAAADGVVMSAQNAGGCGLKIWVQHAEGYQTAYQHLQKMLVKAGDKVKQGQTIGEEGSTGASTGAHLHFEIKKDGKYVNPEDYVGPKAKYNLTPINVAGGASGSSPLVTEDLKSFKYNPALNSQFNFTEAYQKSLWKSAKDTGISYLHMLGIIYQESTFRMVASGDGAYGFCQIQDVHWPGMAKQGLNYKDPEDNMYYGCSVMRDSIIKAEKVGSTKGWSAKQKMEAGLSGYNRGLGGTYKNCGYYPVPAYISRHETAMKVIKPLFGL